jgi:hypothetical protein
LYQIIGIRTLLRVFTWTAVALALIIVGISLLFSPPAGWQWARLALTATSSGIAAAAFLFGILGETGMFPWCCRQRWSCGIFPNLDGEWTGELRSNWPRIAARMSGKTHEVDLLAKPAKIRIKAKLFSVSMSLDTEDEYSDSRTIMVGISRDPVRDEYSLNYIYENRTLNPKPTDEPFHFGAAILTLKRERDGLVLRGPYWTNRNWGTALNTAGIAEFKKHV